MAPLAAPVRAALIGAAMILSAFVAASASPSASAHGTAHDQITIFGNAALTPENGVVSGSGTELDPYVIEGWEIVPDAGYALDISSTSAHLVIRNMHISSEKWDSKGIRLSHVSNVTVMDSSIRVSGYYSYAGPCVLRVEYSQHVRVSNSTVTGLHGPSMSFQDSSDFTIEKCYMQADSGGVFIARCSEFEVTGNVITRPSDYLPLGVDSSDHGILCNNSIWNGNFIASMTTIYQSFDLMFYHNNFCGTRGAKFSSCTNVSWSIDYPGGGNYWEGYLGTDNNGGPGQDQPGSDGIGDTPFVHNLLIDPYPLMQPYLGTVHMGDYIQIRVAPSKVAGLAEIEIETPLEVVAVPVDMYGVERAGVTLTWWSNKTTCTIEEDPASGHKRVFFTGHEAGRYDLVVTDGNVSQHQLINVTLGLVRIVISPGSAGIPFGSSQQFSALGYNSAGPVAISPFWYTISDNQIDQSGLFVATYFPNGGIVGPPTDYSITVHAAQEGIDTYVSVMITLNDTSDLDGDAIPDWWELKYYFDPFNASDALLDVDSDMLTSLQEYVYHSNPRAACSDSDDMPDGYEIAHGLDPLSAADGLLDPDADGLSNNYEYRYGTDMTNPDTDGDFLPDGWEESQSLDPLNPADASLDADSDGLTNLEEYLLGTGARTMDTDNDYLPDGWETAHGLDPKDHSDADRDRDADGLTNLGEYSHHTDLNVSDTDSDGMQDGYEVTWSLDPLDPADALTDLDQDGLSQLQECANGTDPRNNDTDSDSMPDGWELEHQFDPLSSADGDADSDGDGLANCVEFYPMGTDPLSADTDSDDMPDGWEQNNGLDPLNSSDANEDADLDGLMNLDELKNGTLPWNADTDADQLGDAFEVVFSKTNATRWDSDGNGVGDAIQFLMTAGYSGSLTTMPEDWIGMTVLWENYSVFMKTNSSVLSGSFDKATRQLSVDVQGPPGTGGALDLAVPKGLCNASDIALAIDGQSMEFSMTENATHFMIHAEYSHSSHRITAGFMAGAPSEHEEPDLTLYIVAVAAAICVAALVAGWMLSKRRARGRGGEQA